MRVALIAASGLLAAGAWAWTKRDQADAGNSTADSFAGWIDYATDAAAATVATAADTFTGALMGRLTLSKMREVTRADVANPNVQAFLRVIRRGEGTTDADGYRRMFGGALFESFDDHPRQAQTFTLRTGRAITSTAAGAYQFLASTWDETARIMGLLRFTPDAQDFGAVGRIAARGALDDVKAGRFELAIQKTAKEWASLPGSPYGQPVISMTVAQATYTAHGGHIA